MKPIVMVGMMGAGKTTVGKRLAHHLGRQFLDSDQELEAHCGASVATIFDLEGEAGFRKREARMIERLIAQPNVVISTGGGAIVTESTRKLLKQSGYVIYLKAHLADLWNRTKRDKRRPLLRGSDPRGRLSELFEARRAWYEEIAHLTVETGRQPVDTVVDRILAQLDPVQLNLTDS